MKTLTQKLKAMCEDAQGVVLSTDEVAAMREGGPGVVLIDVLTRESFAAAHVPGSISVPLWHPTFTARVERALGGKERPVIVYGSSDRCDASLKAALKLAESGFSRVYRYKGGLQAWIEAEHSIATGAAPVPAPVALAARRARRAGIRVA